MQTSTLILGFILGVLCTLQVHDRIPRTVTYSYSQSYASDHYVQPDSFGPSYSVTDRSQRY